MPLSAYLLVAGSRTGDKLEQTIGERTRASSTDVVWESLSPWFRRWGRRRVTRVEMGFTSSAGRFDVSILIMRLTVGPRVLGTCDTLHCRAHSAALCFALPGLPPAVLDSFRELDVLEAGHDVKVKLS
ncbi:hypothetical protein MRX96_054872 [Rhipicephalus microplus]